MNINGDQWRAGTGCRWMAFCSASDSSAPLMGSAWLDSIMSPDTLWRGCKLSIRPPSPPLMLARLLLLSWARSPWSSCHHSPCSYFPFSLLTAFYILAPTSRFPVKSVSICPEDIDMNFIQVEWNNKCWEGHVHAKFKENIVCLGYIFQCVCCMWESVAASFLSNNEEMNRRFYISISFT